ARPDTALRHGIQWETANTAISQRLLRMAGRDHQSNARDTATNIAIQTHQPPNPDHRRTAQSGNIPANSADLRHNACRAASATSSSQHAATGHPCCRAIVHPRHRPGKVEEAVPGNMNDSGY